MDNFFDWVPLHQHSNLSLLDGFSVPSDIAKTCKEYGYRAAAITDHRNVAAHVKFFKACKDVGIKPILGCEFDISDDLSTVRTNENRSTNHLVVLCKNLDGWYEMLKAVSKTNNIESYYYKARISLEESKEFFSNGNHIAISGHPGSTICDVLFTSTKVYRSKNTDEARTYLKPDWEELLSKSIQSHIDVFGKDNFFIEIQLIDQKNLPMAAVSAECLRAIAKKLGCKTVATADSHYVRKTDAIYQRILLCSNLGRTLPGVMSDIQNGRDVPLGTFFVSENYHIPTFEEMRALHTDEELHNSVVISDMCEDYNILSSPQLPEFECPDGLSEIEYVKTLCREGWKTKLSKAKRDNPVYVDRVKEELAVIEDANLAGYFLIVWDIIRYCRSRGWMTGVGRGSAAGCLISYLIGVTGIDPIPYNLLFSRFYNAGRKGTLPDIDLDVPTEHRNEIIAYIKSKYGEDKVSQMATFSSLMGCSAIKEVLRIEDNISFAEANEITELIPDKSQIADELENMEDASIIKWALINRSKALSKWCSMDEEGNLSGPLASSFHKAIQIEGCYKAQSTHAAGVVISKRPLAEICPIVRDKEGKAIAGLEMGDLEALGHVKFDILGVNILDKLMDIIPFLPEGCDIENLEDKKVWNLFSEGDVKGVFQLERQKRWTKKLKPEIIHHLAALISVIRPGVVEAIEDGKSMTQHYMDRKNGEEEVPLIDPVVDEILKDTYGVLVYQETAMLLARAIAGFTLNEADELRKAIGKKLTSVMAKVKDKFFTGAENSKKVSQEVYVKMFEWIEKSQRYSFNATVTDLAMVQCENGQHKSIKDVVVGDRVKTPNGVANVVNTYNHGMQEVFEITTQSGKKIEATLGHKFLCEDGIIRQLVEIILLDIKIICE